MSKIIIYPTEVGFSVLVSSPHPAVTVDAAWRPAGEIEDAKEFADETAAKSYIARWFAEIPIDKFVIRDPVAEVTQTRDDPRFKVVRIVGHVT